MMASAKKQNSEPRWALFYNRRGQLIRAEPLTRFYSHFDMFEPEPFNVCDFLSDQAFLKDCGIAGDAERPCTPKTRRFYLVHDGAALVYHER